MVPYQNPIPKKKQRTGVIGLLGAWAQAEKLFQIALVLPCAALIGWLAGAWLDNRLHQSWIAIAGIVFGGASGMTYVVRLALAAEKDPAMRDQDNDDSEKGSPGADT